MDCESFSSWGRQLHFHAKNILQCRYSSLRKCDNAMWKRQAEKYYDFMLRTFFWNNEWFTLYAFCQANGKTAFQINVTKGKYRKSYSTCTSLRIMEIE